MDGRDRVVELAEVPKSSIGAPLPVVLQRELGLTLLYYVQNVPEGWDGSSVRVVDYDAPDESVARVTFDFPYASRFGPPNDEAFVGHPLAGRGLHPYGAFEVLDSSWVRQLERMNAVHPSHRPSHFDAYRHFIFTFHDSTFECIAKGFSASVAPGALNDAVLDALGSFLGAP